jgi:hypothetical protein
MADRVQSSTRLELLPKEVLTMVFSYLDGLSLLEVSKVQRLEDADVLWQTLDSYIPRLGASDAVTAVSRVLRHCAACKFANEMYEQVLYHYDIEEDEVTGYPTLVWNNCDGCDDFPDLNISAFYGHNESAQFEFFVRFYDLDTHGIVWEGFLESRFQFDPENSEFFVLHISCGSAGKLITENWTSLVQYLTVDDSAELLAPVLLTIVAVSRNDDLEVSLVLSNFVTSFRIMKRDASVVNYEYSPPHQHLYGSLHNGEFNGNILRVNSRQERQGLTLRSVEMIAVVHHDGETHAALLYVRDRPLKRRFRPRPFAFL